MRVARIPILGAAAVSLLLAVGASDPFPAAQAGDPARLQSGPLLAFSPLAVSGEAPAYADSELERAVRVMTDKLRYQQDEPIYVTLRNGLAVAIHAPPQEPGMCSVVTIEKLTAAGWAGQGACGPEDTAISITLQPSTEITASLSPIVQQGGIQGPFSGKPAGARIVEGDLRDIPPAVPPDPGKPLRVVPQAEQPRKTDFFGALDDALTPGSYRIRFQFTAGSRSQPRQTVYSDAFQVDG